FSVDLTCSSASVRSWFASWISSVSLSFDRWVLNESLSAYECQTKRQTTILDSCRFTACSAGAHLRPWTSWASIPVPPACKAGALPFELDARLTSPSRVPSAFEITKTRASANSACVEHDAILSPEIFPEVALG